MTLKIYDLKCDYLNDPIGIGRVDPVIEWKFEDKENRNVKQKAYKIKVTENDRIVWDTEKIDSEKNRDIIYSGLPLESTSIYQFEVKIWDETGNSTAKAAFFETGLLSAEDWTAEWIEPIQDPAFHEPPQLVFDLGKTETRVDENKIKMEPAQFIRKDFLINKKIKRARIYATAHGIYYLRLNGNRVGDRQLAPGHSAYNDYLEYQSYDVTDYLFEESGNALAMVIGDGWFRGKVGINGQSCQYGDKLAGLLQMEITFTDNSKKIICSDKSWKSQSGPIKYADLFVGEKMDATLSFDGFDEYGFDDTNWAGVEVKKYALSNLKGQMGAPVRICEVLKPQKIWTSKKGEVIVDVGQVVAGRTRLKVTGHRGTEIILDHTEVVDKDGNFYNNIIGKYVNQEDTFILSGKGEEIFDPEFTYHGFRYIRVIGFPGEPTLDNFEILILHSDMDQTVKFTCSDERLNQLQRNIVWSQKGNMVSIPTDCPQREKAGWTGDVQIFASTACVNMDMNAFFRRWLNNVAAEQLSDGQIPNIVPYPPAYHPNEVMPNNTHCSAGWGDVAVILPWTMYQTYGDTTVLSDNYPMMKKWVEYIRYTAENELSDKLKGEMTAERREWQKYLWNTNFHFGDWLTPSASYSEDGSDVDMAKSAFLTMDIVPTIFYVYSTDLMIKTAEILGNKEDASYYEALNKKVRAAFQNEYIQSNGLIDTRLQGIYVLALKFNLIPEEFRQKAINRLLELIKNNHNRLDTGFLSVPFLLDVLKESGKIDTAYDLLFQDECPSWLYEVKMGATTMWEAWQAILPDGSPTSVSYNHYAFGCVGIWMYENIGGIQRCQPGYKESAIRPVLDKRISNASLEIDTVYGKIKNSWKISNGKMSMKVAVPANTKSKIYFPNMKEGLEHSSTDEKLINTGDCSYVEVGSGEYEFVYALDEKVSLESTSR